MDKIFLDFGRLILYGSRFVNHSTGGLFIFISTSCCTYINKSGKMPAFFGNKEKCFEIVTTRGTF